MKPYVHEAELYRKLGMYSPRRKADGLLIVEVPRERANWPVKLQMNMYFFDRDILLYRSDRRGGQTDPIKAVTNDPH